MKTNSIILKICLLCSFLLILPLALAVTGRNVCDECGWVGTPDSRICGNCLQPLNQCLDCMHTNRAKTDFCEKCGMPMAEMRVLGSIDPDLRRELRLGESVRARADLEIQRILHLMQEDPNNTEQYLFDLAMRHRQIDFYSRESQLWLSFLEKFPESEKIAQVKSYASESLRKWSYLMYEQKKFEAAKDLLKQSLRLNPDNMKARRWLGYCLAAMDRS